MSGWVSFLRDGIWEIRMDGLPRAKRAGIRLLRVLTLSVRGFVIDRCYLRASAMTFYTLLSIVPVLAMAFGIAKGFGFQERLTHYLMTRLATYQSVAERLIAFAHSLLDNTRGGLIASAGLLMLFWTVISLLGNIEMSFNEIWGVKRGRSMARKICDYIAVMVIFPILFLAAMSLNMVATARFHQFADGLLPDFSGGLLALLKFSPYAVYWLALTFIYMFMPNTRVKFVPALVGAVVAGTLYQLAQTTYVNFQIGAVRMGAIYGSFAALPLLIIWLQISWLIILFGAEIAFAHQNEKTFEREPLARDASLSLKELIAARLAAECVKQARDGGPPLSAETLAGRFDLPIRLARDVLFQLSEAGVLVHVDEPAGGYLPAGDIRAMTVQSVLTALRDRGTADYAFKPDGGLDRLRAAIRGMNEVARSSSDNLPLSELDNPR